MGTVVDFMIDPIFAYIYLYTDDVTSYNIKCLPFSEYLTWDNIFDDNACYIGKGKIVINDNGDIYTNFVMIHTEKEFKLYRYDNMISAEINGDELVSKTKVDFLLSISDDIMLKIRRQLQKVSFI